MAEIQGEEFKFPDEIEDKGNPEEGKSLETEIQIEIEDDTPEEDRGRTPSDPAKVRALEVEVDDLDKYSKEAKDKLIRMKRVWNDERRAKESADRERQVAIDTAQRLYSENQRIRQLLTQGEEGYKQAVTSTSEMRLEKAKREYKEAYDSGDSDKMMEAQHQLTKAQLELEKAQRFKLAPLQDDNFEVQTPQQYQPVPKPDDKVMGWQERNPWFGQNRVMTATALGVHEDLKDQGVQIGSDDYYAKLDNTMRKRFPEVFEDDIDPLEVDEVKPKADSPKAKPATVVASATRSTAPKRVRLSQSQVAIAKKLGLTPEQYVRELLKMEA
jgi:hypothetical protein